MRQKNILLIGKMNSTMRDISEYLTKAGYFTVQVCQPNLTSVCNIMNVVRPDLVVISLIGDREPTASIFPYFKNEYPSLPCISLGTLAEHENFLRYYDGKQITYIVRSMDNADLYEAIFSRLRMQEELAEEERKKNAATKKHILVVDDDPVTLRRLKSFLEEYYYVSLANSGAKAMVSIGKDRPDIIVLDYDMPVCDGRQVFEMIKADDDLRKIPVIFLTGVSDREHVEAIFKLRPADYLLKPVKPIKLMKTINTILEMPNSWQKK